MLLRTLTFTATLSCLVTALPASAGGVYAHDRLLESHYAEGAFDSAAYFERARFSVGINPGGFWTPALEPDQLLFQQHTFGPDDDGRSVVGIPRSEPDFNHFAREMADGSGDLLYMHMTNPDDLSTGPLGKSLAGFYLRRDNKSGIHPESGWKNDLAGFTITSFVLTINTFDLTQNLALVNESNPAGTSAFQRLQLDVYGHATGQGTHGQNDQGPKAVPTPSAAAAGLGLFSLVMVRRRRRAEFDGD